MNQKYHDIDLKEVTDSIYDKLMNNTEQGIDITKCDMQEVDAMTGYMYFDFDTEKGTKRVHIKITIEDK
jgi:hypothetical protein